MDSHARSVMLIAAVSRLKGCVSQLQEVHEKSFEGEAASDLTQKIEVDLEGCAADGESLREGDLFVAPRRPLARC